MKVKNLLLRGLSIVFLSKIALANECDDIKNYLEKQKVEYDLNIKECKVNSDGKVIELNINNASLSNEDLDKILSYDSIIKVEYKLAKEVKTTKKTTTTTTYAKKSSSTVSKKPTTTSIKGKCGKKYGNCPTGYCCSKYGWCGTAPDYCGTGCQTEFGRCDSTVSTVKGRCGNGYGSCPSGYCCSPYGWCGKSSAYCGTGCQSKFGHCNDISVTTTTK